MRPHRLPSIVAALTLASRLAAQAPSVPGLEPAFAPVAVFNASLYNEQANVREATDSEQAALATEVVRTRLREQLGDQVLADAAVDSIERTPSSVALAGGVACNVRIACALDVGRSLGARWIVLTKVSKTSNLIWLLSGQLIRVATGEIVLDDSTELKGDPAVMVRIGTRIFADRIVRTVRDGGRTTNFPQD
jgi:hypothetical protein